MSRPVNIPRLTIGMTEGTLVEWLVSDGDEVQPGMPIYVLSADKVDNEIEATVGGVIRLRADADEAYPVGTTIAVIE